MREPAAGRLEDPCVAPALCGGLVHPGPGQGVADRDAASHVDALGIGAATLMLEDGEELGVISRTLGHSQIATTADVYAHLTPAMLARTADRMNAVLLRRKRVADA